MKIWEIFPDIAAAVRESHKEVGLFGHHDWIHAFRVGEIARLVALDEWGDDHLSHLAGITGLCHNADRILQKSTGKRDIPEGLMIKLIASWLSLPGFNSSDTSMVINAVLNHDARNTPDDSRVLISLMEGDRVVNLDADLMCRSGQYYHDLPAVDCKHFLDDPEATYRSPKSVLRDIAYSLEWLDTTSPYCFRTRLGKKMAEDRGGIIRTFFSTLKTQLAEEGILPYSF